MTSDSDWSYPDKRVCLARWFGSDCHACQPEFLGRGGRGDWHELSIFLLVCTTSWGDWCLSTNLLGEGMVKTTNTSWLLESASLGIWLSIPKPCTLCCLLTQTATWQPKHQVSKQFWKLWPTWFFWDQVKGKSDFFLVGGFSNERENSETDCPDQAVRALANL